MLKYVDVLVIGEVEEVWLEVIVDFKVNWLKFVYWMECILDINILLLFCYDMMNVCKLGMWRLV